MTSYLFFTIQAGIYYEELKRPLNFTSDQYGLSNWLLRLPLTIYSSDLKEKHVFNEDTVTISTHLGGIEEERWKYLVITQNDGKRLYCTAQVYYEKGLVKRCLRLNNEERTCPGGQDQQFYLPKWLIFMSQEPYFKMQVNLHRIYRQIRKSNPSITHTTNQNLILQYQNQKMKGVEHTVKVNPVQNNTAQNVDMILEYYISKCNSHRGGDTIMLQKQNNMPVLHLYQLKQLAIFQFSHFFNLPLSVKTIKTAVTAILLEKQLIVASSSTNLNVMVIESLLQIVRPLKWQHMLVHNLPSHLIQAANENFMPFIVGVTKKDLQNLNIDERFLLIVDEDRILMPQTLPNIDLDAFPSQQKVQNLPSHFTQKEVLEFSIFFMCNLLEPVVRSRNEIPSQNKQFYKHFKQKTTLCDSFLMRYDSGQVKDFARLLAIEDLTERRQQIEKKLNELVYYVQHPKFLINQTEWIQFYLSKRSHFQKGRQVFGPRSNRMLNLREVKQNVINDNHSHRSIQRVLASSKQHSVCSKGGVTGRSRSIQRLKVSVVKQQKCHPLLAELLENKLGVSSRMG